MNSCQILYLEVNPEIAGRVQQFLKQEGLRADLAIVTTVAEYQAAIAQKQWDVILIDRQKTHLSIQTALQMTHARCPGVPCIFVDPQVDPVQAMPYLRQSPVVEFVTPDQFWRLVPTIERLLQISRSLQECDRQASRLQRMESLLVVIQELSLARTLEAVMQIVRKAARELTGADGATFILRDGDFCYYAEENAIEPLWKGQRFPIEHCIGGWCMLNRQPVAIENVYGDERIPIAAYRPTFIKSLIVVPIRTAEPIGAIGNYWATPHPATPEEVQFLQALADTTSVVMENVQIYTELEQRVRDRTVQLEATNHELEAFSYTLSHDLRTPLTSITMLVGLLRVKYGAALGEHGTGYLNQLSVAVQRMDQLIDEILELHKVTQSVIYPEVVNLSSLVHEIVTDLQAVHADRQVRVVIHENLQVYADPMLLRVLLENLLSNAWKYTSKRSQAEIEVGPLDKLCLGSGFYIRDNGAGFDMNKAHGLFLPFQRLHSKTEFPGTGVGLASVQRVVHKHGGQIWAEAAVDQGATFYVSLPDAPI